MAEFTSDNKNIRLAWTIRQASKSIKRSHPAKYIENMQLASLYEAAGKWELRQSSK